jgi:uncharacterized protein (DUF885 family)
MRPTATRELFAPSDVLARSLGWHSMNRFAVFLATALLAGCASREPLETPDARFQKLAGEFMATDFAAHPLLGVSLGLHQFDGRFVVPSRSSLAAEVARLDRFERALKSISPVALDPEARVEHGLLRAQIAEARWSIEEAAYPFRNPMYYARALNISVYLQRDFASANTRVRHITAILRRAPEVFASARTNLLPVLPTPFVETAIQVAEGTASFLERDVARFAEATGDQLILGDFAAANRTAVAELRNYASWLKRERLPQADPAFALGRARLVRMLQAQMTDLPPEQILERGLSELRAEQQRFADAARTIDPNRKPIDVFKDIQRDHPTAASLLPDTRRNLELIRQFVVDRRIVTIPSEVRPKVQETLPPFRATSFASMDTPGPFETRATQAYYYVTPVEPEWTPQQAEEWLTAFNYYTTDVVSIHEAYPGHYVQNLALNASGAGNVAKVFSSYAFVEGWAHYCEQMLLDSGFAQPGPDAATREQVVRGAKYRLAQSDEALLRLCRLCCSIKMHSQGMTVDEATRFFVENCYYEERPARQEAIRGTFDPGYLNYTLGKLAILKLRRDWQEQEGAAFSLQRFHDELLRHGSPPIRLLREVMLKDRSKWAEVL